MGGGKSKDLILCTGCTYSVQLTPECGTWQVALEVISHMGISADLDSSQLSKGSQLTFSVKTEEYELTN